MAPGPLHGMKGLGEKCRGSGQLMAGKLRRVEEDHLGALGAQVGMRVLESGDGTMTQTPCDCHQCVEVLQLVQHLREGG